MINEIIKYIELNIHDKIVLKDLEEIFGYSERHIRRLFKEETNTSLYSYILERKMINSLVDIKSNIYSLEDVSFRYGYDNYDSFLRTYKNVFKVTPKDTHKLKVDVVFKNMVEGVTAPIITEYNFLKNSLKRENFKDLYWNNDIKRLSSYLVVRSKNNSELVNKALDLGFGNNYIHLIDDETNYDLLAKSVFDNENVEVTNKNLCFLSLNKDEQSLNKKIVNSLSEGREVLLFDADKIKMVDKGIFQITKVLNNKNIKDNFYKNIFKNFSNKVIQYESIIPRKQYDKIFVVIEIKKAMYLDDVLNKLKKMKGIKDYQVILNDKLKNNMEMHVFYSMKE